ncbi:MAG: peptidylprolyl isomerase [Candidatus Omnitrophota bacterium]|nr:MAG: peptidylprolyl isomerase [Candidatus Omnitrophota bacterium]
MKKILWVLAVIIIFAFVLWGAQRPAGRRLPYKYIGTIEGKKISIDEFVKSAQDIQIRLFLSYFDQPEALDKFQKDRIFLNRLAWENLMIKIKAEKDKITVSDEEVVGFITKHPLFARGDAFDDKLYKYILTNNLGMSPRAFEESVRTFLVITKYKTDIIKNITASDNELRQFYKNESEKARLSYIVIDKESFKEKTEVSKNEINDFYEKNKEHFKEPEKVVLQYIAFPHKEEGTKEKALEDLKRAYEKLKRRPRDMEKICRDLNLSVTEMPPFSRDETVRGIEGAGNINIISFKLRPLVDILPAISEDEIGTSYIIRAKERIPPRIKSEGEVSSYIIGVIKDEKAMLLAEREADKLYEEVKTKNVGLKNIAKNYNLELHRTDFISRFDYIEEVGESYKIVTDAFKLKPGELSRPIKARKGFVLVEPIKFLLIDEEKFEKEKENYRNKVLSIKKLKAIDDWLAKIKAASSLDVDLEKL